MAQVIMPIVLIKRIQVNKNSKIYIAGHRGHVVSCSNPKYQVAIRSEVVAVDPRYFRPTEVDLLLGDPAKAEQKLGWNREYNLKDLVNDMMRSDLKLMTKDVYLQEGG